MGTKFKSIGRYLVVDGPLALPPVCVRTGEKIRNGEKAITTDIFTEYWNLLEILFLIFFTFHIPIFGCLFFIKAFLMYTRRKISISYYISAKANTQMYFVKVGAVLLIAIVLLLEIAYYKKIMWIHIGQAVAVSLLVYYKWGRVLLKVHDSIDRLHYISGISPKAVSYIVATEKHREKMGEHLKEKQNETSLENQDVKVHASQKNNHARIWDAPNLYVHREEDFSSTDYSNKTLTSFPESLFNDTFLKKLDMSGNKISRIPSEIKTIINLNELEIKNNPLKENIESLFELPQLTYLGLQNTRLSKIPEIQNKNNQLRQINISSNRIKELPKSIKNLTALTWVDISNNQLQDFPESLLSLPLKQLILQNNFLTSIPCQILELKKLQHLDVAFNNLSFLPTEIFQLTSLKHLSLRGNRLASLPKEIKYLKNLEFLDISDNHFTEIPVELEQLGNLKVLFASNNKIKSFPKDWFLSLVELDLSHNEMEIFECVCPELKKINISHNKLQYVDENIGKSDSLEEINFSNNQLATIPEQVKYFKHLSILNGSFNQIEYVFSDIRLLKKIKSIDLSNNNLKEIPEEWVKLPKTCMLNFEKNPFSQIPFAMVSAFHENLKYDLTLPELELKPQRTKFNLCKTGSYLFELYSSLQVPCEEQEIVVPVSEMMDNEKYIVMDNFWVGSTEKSIANKKYVVEFCNNKQNILVSKIKNKWILNENNKVDKYYYIQMIKKTLSDYRTFVASDTESIYCVHCFKGGFVDKNFTSSLHLQIASQLGNKIHNCFPQVAGFEIKNNYVFVAFAYYGETTIESYIAKENELDEKTCIFYLLQLLSAFKVYVPSYISIMPENIIVNGYQLCLAEIVVEKPLQIHMETSNKVLPYELMNYQKRCYSYVSPETIKHNSKAERTLIFSLGILMYQMRTGKHPFLRGQDVLVVDMLENIIKGHKLPFPDNIGKEYYSQVINKMLLANPDERYQSFDEVLVDVKARYSTSFINSYFIYQVLEKNEHQKTSLALEVEEAKIVWMSLFRRLIEEDELVMFQEDCFVKIENLRKYEDELHKSYITFEYTKGEWLHELIKKDDCNETELIYYAIEIISHWQTLAVKGFMPSLHERVVYITDDKKVKFFSANMIGKKNFSEEAEEVLSIEDGLNLLFPEEIHYRAPHEIAKKETTLGSQIYALGVLLYFAMSKKYPYQKDDILSFRDIEHKYTSISKQIEVDIEWYNIITKATAYTANSRYSSLDEFKKDLEALYVKKVID